MSKERKYNHIIGFIILYLLEIQTNSVIQTGKFKLFKLKRINSICIFRVSCIVKMTIINKLSLLQLKLICYAVKFINYSK